MNFAVIIPTYNRIKDLGECLDSLFFQTYLPRRVIIVDNSSNNSAEECVKNKKDAFEKKNIYLVYIKNQKENSLTAARNKGVENIQEDIVLFLDDDVLLDKDYIKEILKVYEKYPDAVGVQGYIFQGSFSRLRNLLYKAFFLYHLEKNSCRALPSVSATYPSRADEIISCQWLSGANHSFKRKIFNDFKYDEKLKKYSEGEDLELSYRVFKKYPGLLYLTPYAKLIHKTSSEGRVTGKELIYMREVYGLYLFYKLFEPVYVNKIIYTWSRAGRFLFAVARGVVKRPPGILAEIINLAKAYFFCLNNIGKIKCGDLDFFNKTLK